MGKRKINLRNTQNLDFSLLVNFCMHFFSKHFNLSKELRGDYTGFLSLKAGNGRDSRHFLSCLANYIIARLWTSVIKKSNDQREKESCY